MTSAEYSIYTGGLRIFKRHLRCMLTLVSVYMHSGMAEEAGGWAGSVTVCVAMCICIQRWSIWNVQQPSWVYLWEGERFSSEFPGTGTVWERSKGGNSSGSVRLDGDVMWVLKVVWGGQTESDDSFTLSSTFPELVCLKVKSRSVSMKLNTKCCCVSGLFLCNTETFAASKGFGLTVTH